MKESLPKVPWHSRFDLPGTTFILFLLLAFSSSCPRGSGRLGLLRKPFSLPRPVLPPDWSILGQTTQGLWETIQIAGISTFLASSFSLFFSLGAARTISPSWVVFITRMILNLIRTIPSLLWAILAVVLVGSNSLAGVIALTFYSTGYLAKFFSEAFESADLKAQKACKHLVLADGRLFSMDCGLIYGPSSGAIAYGCLNTMFALQV